MSDIENLRDTIAPKSPMITKSRLKEMLEYNGETGIFTRISKCCGAKIGNKAGGSMKKGGYIRIKIDGRMYMSHRLVWLYVFGSFPDGEIDHINGVRTDNRLSNLRVVTKKENLVNKRKYSNSTSGVTGVNWHKQHRKWAATICLNGRKKHLGLFDSVNSAKVAREKASMLLGFHVNHGNTVTI